ncbi:MAG: sulfite exporter TauE/SafE family protein [Caldisericia bacterium]|nr:sulfite exporter TauE/SafE family protein [Caldisericia bacterium]MDD4614019.1 sulfite exporter TauE/SafE family protein [Caldisericia bacterium]
MQNWFIYICIGFTGGVLSGLLGIGGGIVIIPLLMLMGHPQLTAQGTTLALMVLPIGLLGALEYFKHGHVEVLIGLFVVSGFFLGTLLGAKSAMRIPTLWLKRIFGVIMIFAALRMMFAK